MLDSQKNSNLYDKYKDSGIKWIGAIPDSWCIRKLNSLLNAIGSGTTPKGNDNYYDGDIYWLNTGDLNDSYISTINKTVTEIALQECSTLKIFPKDSVVIAMYGATIGKLGILMFPATTNQACCVMSCSEQLNNKYLFYLLFAAREFIINLSYGAGQPNISQETIKSFRLSFPSIKEQEVIAVYLDRKCGAIDETIEKQKSVIEKLKEYKQSIITQAVTKGLDKSAPMKDSGIEWIGQIPQHWEISKIKFSAIVNPKYNENLSSDTLVSFAPMECLTNCNLECKDAILSNVLGSYTYFANNDIIMAKVTPCFENGNIALATNLNNGVGFGSSELYVFRSINIFDKFLLYLLQNTQFKDNAIATMYGTGGLKRVSIEFVKNYKFACPDLKEQEQIAAFLDKKCSEIDKTIEDKEKLIEKLVEYKKSLIYECVTGKRKVVA